MCHFIPIFYIIWILGGVANELANFWNMTALSFKFQAVTLCCICEVTSLEVPVA